MREFSISVDINAPATIIWQALMDFDHHQDWNPMFSVQQRQLCAGGFLHLAPKNSTTKRPKKADSSTKVRIEAIEQERALVLSRSLMHSSLVHMTHYFELKPGKAGCIIFTQRWQATGILIPIMWGKLCQGMATFDRLNQALKSHAEQAEIAQH